jgi:hypothetical protein
LRTATILSTPTPALCVNLQQNILQCLHPSRVVWRKSLETTLSKSCVALKTDHILKSILLNGMKCWLQQVQFDDGGIPFQYHALLQDQHDIGWYNIFLAQFATQWAQCQSLFLQTLPTPIKGLSGEKWVSVICTVITKAWLDLWELCNKDRHGADSILKSVALHAHRLFEKSPFSTLTKTLFFKKTDLFSPPTSTNYQQATPTTSDSGSIHIKQ